MSLHSFAPAGSPASLSTRPSLIVVHDEEPTLTVIERVAEEAGYDVILMRGPCDSDRLRTVLADIRGEVASPPPSLRDVERGHIVDMLRRVNGNRMAAAKLLGISRRALYRRLDRHHITNILEQPQ
jgi:transcriptional regulator of acetoin/glycerol metabolism